jgi:hypothetical protein
VSKGRDRSHLLAAVLTLSRKRGVRWLMGAGVIVIAGVLVASLPKFRSNSNAAEAPRSALGSIAIPKPAVSENEVNPDPPVLKLTSKVERASGPVSAPPRVPEMIAALAPAPVPIPASPDQPVAAGTGLLAISSPTTVDIYENDAYLGSAPVSLQLSAGTHTLEYRHGSLRKNVTHNINGNQTVKATITFEVSIQINSKPWAEVSTDGADKKDLGQTPLSGVRVPIGSVLIFQNPQFQSKKYRITGNETGIQNVFP